MALVRKLGAMIRYRGSFLLFLALLDAIYAYAIVLVNTENLGIPQQEHLLLPWPIWAAWWSLTGAACLGGSFMLRDSWSFTLACAIKSAWGGLMMWNWLRGYVPFGWISGVIFLAFATLTAIVAGWPDPPPVHLDVGTPRGNGGGE